MQGRTSKRHCPHESHASLPSKCLLQVPQSFLPPCGQCSHGIPCISACCQSLYKTPRGKRIEDIVPQTKGMVTFVDDVFAIITGEAKQPFLDHLNIQHRNIHFPLKKMAISFSSTQKSTKIPMVHPHSLFTENRRIPVNTSPSTHTAQHLQRKALYINTLTLSRPDLIHERGQRD